MITVVAIKNPLDPWGSQQIIYLPDGTSIDDCIDAVYPPIPTTYDLAVSYNGNQIDVYSPPIPPDGCSIVFMAIPQGMGDSSGGGGGGKNIIKMVVGAVLTVVGFILNVGSYGSLSALGVPMMTLGIGMMIGGVLGLLLAPSEQAMIGSTGTRNLIEGSTLGRDETGASSSSTYGWNTHGNKIGEGITLPELYGEMRIVPPLIGKYVQVVGDKQYLYLLFALCRWDIDTKETNAQFESFSIKQVETALRGVYINDIESVQFGDVSVNYAPGRNIQNSLPGFADTRTDVVLSRLMTTEWFEFDTVGSFINGIMISFVFPYGLYGVKPSETGGTTSDLSVNLYFEHAPYQSGVHTYQDNEYVTCSQIMLSDANDFRLSYWSAGYFNGERYSDGMEIWVELDHADAAVAHQRGELYTPVEGIVLPVGTIVPICQWFFVNDGVLDCDSVAKITKYKVFYDLENEISAVVTKNITSSFSVDFLIANTPMENLGRRHIRCKRDATTVSAFTGRDSVSIQLCQEIVYRELTYPNVSLVGLKALATDKLSGSLPTISVVVSRSILYVWGPNPTYPDDTTLWQYNVVKADNPAWVCYDLLHGCRPVQNALTEAWEYVQSGPIKKENMNYYDFKDWADFCDTETHYNCHTKNETMATESGWIALSRADRYPVVDDTFDIPFESVGYTVTDKKLEYSATTLLLTNESSVTKGEVSFSGLDPREHISIPSGLTFTVTPAAHVANPNNIPGSVLTEETLAEANYMRIENDGVTVIPQGTVFTVGTHLDQYVVSIDAYSGLVPFEPKAKQTWPIGTNVYIGVEIIPGVVTTYTTTEICSSSTIYFTPACDTIWPRGSTFTFQVPDTFLTASIKITPVSTFIWPADTALYCVDHETVADYPYKKKYTCNVYFDVTTNLKSALGVAGLCGRGSVIQVGSKYSCVVERAEKYPVQRFIFNMANMEDSSFNESWMSLDERSNCFEIKYWDRLNDFKEDVVTVQSDSINNLTEIKRTAIDLIGCTDEAMAIAFGKYLLNVNRYITLTASWTAHVDSIGCFPGQIVEVQHDVPQFGYGGRLIEGCTTSTLFFDRDLTLIPDTDYEIVFYYNSNMSSTVLADDRVYLTYTYDGAEEISTNTITGFTDPLTSLHTIAFAPTADSKFIFGEVDRSCTLMRILSITKDSDLKNKIVAIEFNNNVYSDGTIITPRNSSNLLQELRPPKFAETNVSLTWELNTMNKIYDPYIKIEGKQYYNINYRNINPITKYKIYAHFKDGDTRSTFDKNLIVYDGSAELTVPYFKYIATDLNGKTIYIAMTQVNNFGYESLKAIAEPFYITTAYDDLMALNLEIDSTYTGSTQGFTYAATSYKIALKWTPIGWELDSAKYIPIIEWNDGSNWYMYSQYAVVYGFVSDKNDIPELASLKFVTSLNIGDMFDSAGNKITDLDILHSNALAAAQVQIEIPYSFLYLKIAVVAIKKLGGLSHIDMTQNDLGLDWVSVRMMVPYDSQTVLTTEIEDFELVVTPQGGAVYLNEIRWDYPLVSPKIDAFVIIYRLQKDWWSWPVTTTIPKYKTGTTPLTFLEILEGNYVDFTLGGGADGSSSFVAQITKWQEANDASRLSGNPIKHKYIYMSLTHHDQYEIFRVSIDDETIGLTERNIEKLPTVFYETIMLPNLVGSKVMFIAPTHNVYSAGDIFIVNNNLDNVYEITSHPSQTVIYFQIQGGTTGAVVPFGIGEEVMIGDLDNSDGLQAWEPGTVLSYMPNEWNDSLYVEYNTTVRNYIFPALTEISCAMHLTMIAAKMVPETQIDQTPGYERTPYSVWEAKLQS